MSVAASSCCRIRHKVASQSCERCMHIEFPSSCSARICARRCHGSEPSPLCHHPTSLSGRCKPPPDEHAPGSHVSSLYSDAVVLVSAVRGLVRTGAGSGSNPVPPPGKRTRRSVMGVEKCDPGKNDSAPFVGVHLSNAIQKPNAVGGVVYYSERVDHRKCLPRKKIARTRNVLESAAHWMKIREMKKLWM